MDNGEYEGVVPHSEWGPKWSAAKAAAPDTDPSESDRRRSMRRYRRAVFWTEWGEVLFVWGLIAFFLALFGGVWWLAR